MATRMTHEPECEHEARPFLPCICELLRQAYVRGYRDMCLSAKHAIDKSESETVSAIRQKRRLTYEFLLQIANDYKTAEKMSELSTSKYIATKWGVSIDTADSWIKAARHEHGLLPKVNRNKKESV